MKKLILTALLMGAAAFAQETFHVTAVQEVTRDHQKTYRTVFNQNVITGRVGNRRYTLEQLASWGFYHFQTGADYPVVSLSDKTLKVRVTDKKGRESTESLNVVAIEEIPELEN